MDGEDKLGEAAAYTSTGPSPMKPRTAPAIVGHEAYTRVPQDTNEGFHARTKSADLRLATSLRDSDLTEDAGESDKPMRRSVSWPDWSENRCVPPPIWRRCPPGRPLMSALQR